ncbi:hypothetical protein GCM10027262_63630 [Nocardia tengchongensis]
MRGDRCRGARHRYSGPALRFVTSNTAHVKARPVGIWPLVRIIAPCNVFRLDQGGRAAKVVSSANDMILRGHPLVAG